MEKPEILSFTFQEMYLSRKLIKSRVDLIKYIKFLSNQNNIPTDKIIFHHDFNDNTEDNLSFMNNFKINNSYKWIPKHLNTTYSL